jgi:hypothetical protein
VVAVAVAVLNIQLTIQEMEAAQALVAQEHVCCI